MGAIMINIFDQMPSVAFFKANADKLGQNYELEIKSLTPLNAEKIAEINTPNFELAELSESTFIENAKAYTFNFNGIECAYLMLKVISSENESLWLASELRQYKDSWFFDFADVNWLSLKVSDSTNLLVVDELKLFPIALLTQFKDVEVNIAFTDFPFYQEKINLLRKHSNCLEHCFDPKKSLAWMWTVSKFGYCLSQYSSEVLVHTNSGIKAKNQQLPFILTNGDNEYKALSLAVQVGDVDNDDCFWVTTLFDRDGQMKTEGFILSYGHYPHDLPVRKLVAPNFIEESIFLTNDEVCLENVEIFFKSLMLEKSHISDYLEIVKGILATYLNADFQNRLLYSCDYSERVEVSRLIFSDIGALKGYLAECDPFVSNLQMYQNTTSFPASMYVPNMDNSIVEDIPESLKAVEKLDSSDESSIYDEQQPDFNTESRLGVMQTPKSNDGYGSNYGKNSKRVLDTSPMAMNFRSARTNNVDDIDSAIENNERKKRHQKSQPVVVHRRRWGLVAKERRDQIQQELSGVPVETNNGWDIFKETVSAIDAQDAVTQTTLIDHADQGMRIENSTLVNEPTIIEKAEPTVIEKAEPTDNVSDDVLTFDVGEITVQLGQDLRVTLKPYGVVVNYPKNLIDTNFNYIFNNLIALGVDPYESRNTLVAINAPVKRYSYAKALKMVKQASLDDLKLYKGFELYIDLVERELKLRN